jgi:phosphate transport system substrate-binding protein
VPLAASEGEAFVPVTPEHAYTGDYPLSRFLNLAVNYKPGSTLDPLRAEYIKYIYSRQGQEDVVKEGYYPVTAEIARVQLKSVAIEPGF